MTVVRCCYSLVPGCVGARPGAACRDPSPRGGSPEAGHPARSCCRARGRCGACRVRGCSPDNTQSVTLTVTRKSRAPHIHDTRQHTQSVMAQPHVAHYKSELAKGTPNLAEAPDPSLTATAAGKPPTTHRHGRTPPVHPTATTPTPIHQYKNNTPLRKSKETHV